MTTRKACPSCQEDGYLYSVERAIIEYPITVEDDAEGNRNYEYTGGESLRFDESASFSDEIHCRSCDWEGTIDALVSAP